MSLKRQIQVLAALIFLGPLVLSLISIGIDFKRDENRDPILPLVNRLNETWQTTGQLTSQNVSSALQACGMSWVQLIVSQADGTILAKYPANSINENPEFLTLDQFLYHQALEREEYHLMRLSNDPGSPLLLVNLEIFHRRTAEMWRTFSQVGLLLSLILLVSSLMAFWLIRTLNRNVRKLVSDTARVANGDLDHPVNAHGTNEFHTLAASIDGMRLSLKETLHRQSLLFMGMSHDLKTPVSLIQGYTDALIDGIYPAPEDQSRSLHIIRSKSRQLQELIDEFIFFIRAQTGGNKADAATLADPVLLIKQICQRFSDDALLMERRFIWGFGPAMSSDFPIGQVSLSFQKTLTERAIENLLGNALRYSPVGSLISLTIEFAEDGLIISIADSGPGIALDELPFVFDPFYRGSKSREDGGHGLGLAVVKAVMDLHGWTIDLGPRRDGQSGLEVRVRMALT